MSVRRLGPAAGGGIVEVTVDGAAAAALISVTGSEVSAPAWLDARAVGPSAVRARTTVDARSMRIEGARAYVVFGARAAVRSALAQATAARLEEAARTGGLGAARVQRLELDGGSEPFTEGGLAAAVAAFDRGDPGGALDRLERLRASAPGPSLAQLDALGSEAAFEAGRTRLAWRIATRGLGVAAMRDARGEARLLRALILAAAEGPDVQAPPPERERLRATAPQRDDPFERLLDAALDVQVAERIDRASPLERRTREPSERLFALLDAVPQERAAGVAGAACAAASFLEGPSAEEAMRRARELAAVSKHTADRVLCAIKAADVARGAGRLREADDACAIARAELGSLPLPRQRREVEYTAAVVAAARGDFAGAYGLASAAATAVDDLLRLETDADAREFLLSTTVGYYAQATVFAIRAGLPAEAVFAAESGKAQAYAALLRGGDLEPSAGDGANRANGPSGPGDWWIAPASERAQGAGSIRAQAAALGGDDAALSYIFAPAGDDGVPSIAIGVLTRESVHAVRVPYGPSFVAAFHELPAAVRANDAAAAARAGKSLFDVLLAPVLPWIAAKRRLFLSLQSTMHKLPFGALHDGAGFLAQRFALARVPPLLVSRLGGGDDRSAPGGFDRARWLVVIDPTHPPLPALPGIDALGQEIEAGLHPVVTLRGAEATPDRLLHGLAQVDAMLYAGHAEYDAAWPLQSALLVAPSADGDDRVEAASILTERHPLDLVLLIGCETGRQYSKRAKFSDDLVGLPRALLIAGASHVVGALWPLLDRDGEDFLRALARSGGEADTVTGFQRAQRCLAEGACVGRGIASWASYVLDAR